MIAISKKANLWLTPCGDGNDKRFARIFKKTWQQIPAEPRRTMRLHWPESLPSIMLLAALVGAFHFGRRYMRARREEVE